MPSNQMPAAATMSDEAIKAVPRPRGYGSIAKQRRAIADAARDLAYRVCRQEAEEVMSGLVRTIEDAYIYLIDMGHEGLRQELRSSLDRYHKQVDK